MIADIDSLTDADSEFDSDCDSEADALSEADSEFDTDCDSDTDALSDADSGVRHQIVIRY
ncbi:MAG: hypothetical protein ACLRSA_03325 [Streptococcus salivarius]